MSGADTPKDLSSRIKILELFTLHVLPRNEEWEYSKTFITNSDVLDEERKEAFLQTLQELEEGKDHDSEPFADVEEDYRDEEQFVNAEESQQGRGAGGAIPNGISAKSSQKETSSHRRTSSEVDYGIDQARPNGASMKPSSNGTTTMSNPSSAQATATPSQPPTGSSLIPTALPAPSSSSNRSTPPSKTSKPPSKSTSSNPKSKPKPTSKPSSSSSSNVLLRRAQQILLLFRTMSSNLSTALTKSPAALLRTVMFVVGILVMLSRKDLRERMRQIVETGWGKVKGTVGMGTKVSYI